ncbi:MAG TPA: cache domain-containing protein [Polyangiaceae bacterium]|nr:cache domain-containing protein [Polyangiaceae bacterium]
MPLERWLGLSRDAPGPIDSELGFDQVALISGDGQVLYAPGDDSTLRIQKLPDVVDKTSTSSMLRAVEIGTTRYRVFHQPLAVEPLMHCDDEKAVSSAESAERGCTEKAQLGIVGLVREDRLATESYRVSPTSFLWAILLVGLGILSLPLAKLWFIGPRSRLRRFDVALLATSAVCVTLLAVVLTLTFAARNRLLSRLDGELQSVGFDTSRELSARLEGGASVLNDFVVRSQDERRSIRNAQLAAPGERVAACAGSFAWLKGNDGEPTWPICETAQATLLNNTYEWRLAFWANEQGQQQVKYLPGRIGTNAVNVEGRGYFQNARAGQVDCLARKGCASDVEHWGTAEVVRSATTGDIVLVVARPTLNDEQKVDGVAAVELPLDGLEAPLLPLGMQMAVIDEDGRVMLHSNNDGHHGQRLFDQIDHLAELRATLAARTSSAMMLRYLGVPSRAWITPLAGTDWHVLTLSPLAVADAPAAGMLLVTLVGFASYVVGILLLVGCFVFVKGALRWLNPDSVKNADLGILSLRPDGTRSRAYANAALGLIVWSSLACVFAVWIGASLPLILLLATSLLVGGILALGVPGLGDGSETSIIGRSYRRIGSLVTRWSREASRSQAPALPVSTADRRKRSWKDDITLAYALCYFGLAGAFIAVPATIWFASAFDHFAEGVVRAEQHHLARALRYRHDCVLSLADGTEPLERPGACQGLFDGGVLEPAAPAEPAEASAVPVAAPNGRTSLAAAAPGVSLDNPAGTPGAVGAGRRLRNWLASGCSQLQPTWPIRCLVDSLPPFEALQGSASARLYRAAEFSATSLSLENAWAWLRSTGRLILVLPGTPSARVESAVPQLFDQEYDVATLVLLLALFGVFLTCAHTAAFHSMRRLFALDVIARWQRTPPVDLEELLHDLGNAARGRSGRKLLVVYPPSQMLSTLRANNGWTELGSGGSGGASRYVPNLIDVLNDDATLQLVATAARAPGSLIVLASADPFRRLSDPLAARWAQALEPFDTVRSIGASAAATPAPLSRARCERLWEDSDEAERRMMGQLAIDGYANLAPENTDTVEQLTARNIFGKHNLTFANPSFARFVRTKISASDLDTWDQSDGGSLWSTVRVPLATSVAAAVAIFGSSAPELTATGAALVPTIAAGFPTVLRVLLSLAQGETPGD